ncbi:hypothetical protein DXC12_09135 [Melissococcus sp. OM08-11BH]|nr:hypothetical protein DXC12_09135 [Melissococcus sp. OM08-11BH]
MTFITIRLNQKTIQKYIQEQETNNRIRGSKQIRVYDYQFNKKSLEQTRLLIAPAVGLEPTTS